MNTLHDQVRLKQSDSTNPIYVITTDLNRITIKNEVLYTKIVNTIYTPTRITLRSIVDNYISKTLPLRN